MTSPMHWTGPDEYAPIPGRYAGDVGIDLYMALEDAQTIPALMGRFLPAGISVQLPPNTWGMITGRSSTNKTGLLVMTGVIDTGYRGELGVNVHNLTAGPIDVEPGQRLGQLIVMPALYPSFDAGHNSHRFEIYKVDTLNESSRSTNGWGSSGK